MKLPAIISRFVDSFRGKGYSAVPSSGGWFGVIRESFAGAFQSNVEVDAPKNILAFSAVFACVTLIANDIAKLELKLTQELESGVCVKAPSTSPYWNILRKPNHFQNRIQFLSQWLISKLLYGNTYVLKERDARGIVTALYILDAQRVTPMVSDSGEVYYQLAADHLAGLPSSVTVSAREIIHDRMCCLWHPLVGISPIYACGMSATMGNKIQANSAAFFANMSRPGGMLTAPDAIDDETANRLKAEFEQNFAGKNMGRLFVAGDGLNYQTMSLPAEAAQLIEQLNWTVTDVARCFHVPLFKIGAESGKMAGNLSVEAQQQLYLNDCLHIHIEDIELCLEQGIGADSKGYEVEIDEEGLLRMDTVAKAEAVAKLVGGMIMSPDEGRAKFDLPPVPGGASPLAQQQNYSLAALAKRDAQADPFSTGKSTTQPTPAPQAAEPSPATAAEKQAAEQAAEFMQILIKGLEHA